MTDLADKRKTRDAVWATIDHIISELEAALAELDKEWERAVEEGDAAEVVSREWYRAKEAREAAIGKRAGVYLAWHIAAKAYQFSPEAQPVSV
jgi:hypothetical protein